MKKLVSLLLAALMLITAGSAFADDAANQAKPPFVGGFDLDLYDKDGDKANGIDTNGLPGWFASRIPKKSVEVGFTRYDFDERFDCCIFCVIAGDNCGECTLVWGPVYHFYYEYEVEGEPVEDRYTFSVAHFRWCGVANCYCMEFSVPEVNAIMAQWYLNFLMDFTDHYARLGFSDQEIDDAFEEFMDEYGYLFN